MKKRLLSALLTVGMLLTLVPAAFAAGAQPLGNPTDLQWGRDYGEVDEEGGYANVPGAISWRSNAPDDNIALVKVYQQGATDPVAVFNVEFGDNEETSYRTVLDFTEHDALVSGQTYYFTVQSIAAYDSEYTSSTIARSGTWTYTAPTAQLPQVQDPVWDGTTAKWTTLPADAGNRGYQIQLFYRSSPSADLQQVEMDLWVSDYRPVADLSGYIAASSFGDGYYYFKVRAQSKDVSAIGNGPWSELSAPYLRGVAPSIFPAILADNSADPITDLCQSYFVTDSAISDPAGEYTLVNIHAKDLKPHKNANGQDGYWIGFAVAAPDDAAKMKVAFAPTKDALTLSEAAIDLEANVTPDGDAGVAFYTNAGAVNNNTWAQVQWIKKDGTVLDDAVTYRMDLYNVSLAPGAAYTPDIRAAKLHDNSTSNAIPDGQLFAAGTYDVTATAGADDTYEITLAAKDLKPHENGNHQRGLWVGFDLAAPVGATKFMVNSSALYPLEPLPDGRQGVALYFDASDQGTRDVTLRWCADNGVAVGSPLSFHVDLSQVAPYLPTVETAKLHDNSTENAIPDDQLFTEGSYSAAVKAGADGVYDVVLTADQLKEHANGQDPAVRGHWIGFAVAAPEAAQKMKVAFATDKAGLATLTESDLEPNVIGDKSGVAFYANASAGAAAKTWAQVQWLDAQEGNVLSSTVYHIDLSGVTLALPADAPEITTAKLHDTSNALQDDQLYTKDSYTADLISQNIDGSYNVALAAKQLREHVNGQGTRGHWIGFELAAPTGATQFKVNDGAAEALEALPNDRQGVAFYFNASDLSARTLTLTWLNDEDQTVGSPLTFHVDLSQVEKYVAPSHGGGGGGGGGGGSTTPTTPTDPTTPTNPTTKGFSDVAKNDWFADSVAYVVDKGLMQGTSATTFAPNATTTRGMIVTILHRLEGTPSAAVSAFTDVSRDAWYAAAVDWAAANGIVNGTSATTFAPNDPITREQLAAILYRYAAFKGYDTTKLADLAAYRDAASVSAYAKDAMAWANAAGLISGVTPDTLAPTGSATRAQVATILMRLCETVMK